jgi:Fungal Zn(2)-Cys(6) binuclear cluster domain
MTSTMVQSEANCSYDSTIQGDARSKRVACDRCRAQKLRCTSSLTYSEACDRCRKAGISCIHSPPLRAGRRRGRPGRDGRPQAERTRSFRRGRRASQSSQPSPDPSRSNLDVPSESTDTDPLHPKAYAGNLDAIQQACDTSKLIAQDGNSFSQVRTQLEELSETTSTPQQSPSHLTSLVIQPSPSHLMREAPEIPSASSPLVTISNNSLLSEDFFAFDDFDFFNEHTTSVDDAFVLPGYVSSSNNTDSNSNFHVATSTTGPNADKQMDVVMAEIGQPHIHPADRIGLITGLNVANGDIAGTNEMQTTGKPVERLAELNLSLSKVKELSNELDGLNETEHGYNARSAADPSSHPNTNLIDQVLALTQQFLDVVESMSVPRCLCYLSAEQEMSHASLPSPQTNGPLPYCNKVGQISDCARPVPGCHSNTNYITPQSESPCSSVSPADGGRASVDGPDIQTILMIIACHVCVLRIYTNLFAHIVHVIRTRRHLGDRNLSLPFPEYKLGSLGIRSSGNLQFLILAQVSTHMLNRLDRALGCDQRGATHAPYQIRKRQIDRRERQDARMPAGTWDWDWLDESGQPHRRTCSNTEQPCRRPIGLLGEGHSLELLEIAIGHERLEKEAHGRPSISTLAEKLASVSSFGLEGTCR